VAKAYCRAEFVPSEFGGGTRAELEPLAWRFGRACRL
jgi:hypothetical protein